MGAIDLSRVVGFHGPAHLRAAQEHRLPLREGHCGELRLREERRDEERQGRHEQGLSVGAGQGFEPDGCTVNALSTVFRAWENQKKAFQVYVSR